MFVRETSKTFNFLFSIVKPLDQLLSLEACDVRKRPQLLLTEVPIILFKHFSKTTLVLVIFAAVMNGKP